MNGTAGTGPATVADYAVEVRRHLADLPAEQVDDLTDGLEADLADALADPAGRPDDMPPGLTARFGTPADYARELRTAAGLPAAVAPPGRPGAGDRLRAVPGVARSRVLRATSALRDQPWWPGVRDFGLAVRPLWWLLRAWVVYQVVLQLLGGRYVTTGGSGGWVPTDVPTWLLLGALVVVSVQWGRGLWLPRSGRWLPAATGTAAVLLLLPATVWASQGAVEYRYDQDVSQGASAPTDGVWVDGMQVSNLFVYDAEGDPLQDVQLYDDRGRPVRTTVDEGGWYALPGVDEEWSFVPAWDADGRKRWNVYPLSGAPSVDFGWDENGGWTPQGEARTPPWPFAKAPEVLADGDVEGGSAARAGGSVPEGAAPEETHAAAESDPGPVVGPADEDASTQDQGPGSSPDPSPQVLP